MAYQTALRGYTAKRIEEIGSADILMGIPCFNNQDTIVHVVQSLTHGLAEHYGDKRSVILIADGGSTDDTREVARDFEIKPWQEKVVSIYRGPGGKGTALRSIFEAAVRLNVSACGMVDSDLRSITGDWVKFLLDPVLEKGYQFVAPVYLRHKYDGTITNNIVYNMTRALYGKRVRQPIGGDFAITADLAKFYCEQDVWGSEVARYGIDIWMTTSAITHGFKVCQSNLGVKIHDAKDPSEHLAPMFRQVVWTLFSLMERYEDHWRTVSGSEPVETFDFGAVGEPEPVQVNLESLLNQFRTGYQQFGALWKSILPESTFKAIAKAAEASAEDFSLPTEIWIEIMYELAATYHLWDQNRMRLVELCTPLYFARVASFVKESLDMSSQEAENLVEQQACLFEEHKEMLVKAWSKPAHDPFQA